MRKYKAARIYVSLIAAVLTIFVDTRALASTLIEINGGFYSLTQKSETNFEDGKYTGVGNGGTIELDTIDAGHGQSLALGAASGFDIAQEGAWTQINGDKTQSVSAYECDIYVEKMASGNLRFMQKGINSSSEPAMYLTTISPDGISNGSVTKPFEFGAWHKVRFIYDCGSHYYSVYVDDMENAVFGGAFNEKFDAVQYMRITLWAADAYVAVDNLRYYSLVKMIDGYEKPRLSLKAAEEKITESEIAHIEANIETKAEIESVRFYVNDELVYTDTEAPYVLEWLFEKGEYTVRAEATDVYGETGESSVNISSLPDTKPRIIFGLNDGGTYDKSELKEVSVSVTMSNAELKKGTIESDGTEIAGFGSGNNKIDLSGLSIGRHKITVYAENNLGQYAERTVNITVNKAFDNEIWSMNFNDGSTLGHLNGSGQFTKLATLREDFKDSLLVGADATQDVSLEGAWIQYELKNTTTIAKTDFDIYFNNINGNGVSVMLVLATNRPVLFKITKDGIATADGQIIGLFEADHWYHATLTVDSQSMVFSLTLDNEEIFQNQPINMEQGAAMPGIRLVSMLQGTEETYFAVDNISVRQITHAPSIINITSSKGGENTVSSNDREINVYFSGALQPSSVYPAKFIISGANIKETVYDVEQFCVTLTLEKPLSVGTHRLITAENLVMGNGEIYAEKLYGDFTVNASMIETVSASISDDRITAEIMNNLKDSKDTYMIINLYSGNTMKTSSVKKITLAPGANSLSEIIPGYTSGDKAEIFMWDCLTMPTCFMTLTN